MPLTRKYRLYEMGVDVRIKELLPGLRTGLTMYGSGSGTSLSQILTPPDPATQMTIDPDPGHSYDEFLFREVNCSKTGLFFRDNGTAGHPF